MRFRAVREGGVFGGQCSVGNGSTLSSAYPCSCGTSACSSGVEYRIVRLKTKAYNEIISKAYNGVLIEH